MQAQQARRAVDGLEHTAPPGALSERGFHRTADSIPLGLLHGPGDAPVGQYLDAPVDQLHIDHRLIWHGRRVCHARAPACREG